MKTVTNGFKEEIAKLGREIDFRFFLYTNDKIITQDGKFLITHANQHLVVEQFDEEEIDETINAEDIYSVSIVNRGNLLSTMMKELDFEITKDLKIGDIIECEFGLKVEGNYEYINYGKYMIYEKDFNEDTKTFNYIAYDRMLLTMQEASQDFLEDLEGRTLANCINVICGKVGLSFNATQEELTEYPNLSKQINEGTFTDMQITYRDILDMICQALGLSMIVEEKTLVLKPAKDNTGKFVPYEIKGNTIQEGTPTPSNPVEIQNITGQVKHNGKTVDLGNIELCKIGEYQDKIYKNNDKWYIHKEIGKVVLNGSENWKLSGTDTFYIEQDGYPSGTHDYLTMSDYYTYSTWDNRTNSDYNTGLYRNGGWSIARLFIRNKDYTTVNDFKTWLSNNNAIIYYTLSIPTNTEITDTALINQLNDAGILNIEINEQYIKDTNVSFGKKYMVNSVVLSRSEENDNIYRRDEESIAENGVHEFKIKDNLIMLYDDREDYIDEIFEQLNGLEYYVNDFTSTGITYLDWLDFYNVNIGDKTYKCLMLNDEINIEQGLEENIYTEEPEEAVTDYKTSSKTDKEVSFIVDKQNARINGTVKQDDIIASLNVAIEDGQGIVELKGNTVTIESDNFQLDADGKVIADDITVNNGTFKGNINTNQDCTIGNNLYIGTSGSNNKQIIFTNNDKIKWSPNGNVVSFDVRNLATYLPSDGTWTILKPYPDNPTQYGGIIGNNDPYQTWIGSFGTNMFFKRSTINASTQITVSSDERLKQKIKNIDVSWIDELKVKEFEYIKIPDKKQVGLIAQDYIEKDYSKYFLSQEDGYYGIAYQNITNALIQYCQEMKKEINSLKEEIKQLKEDK